MPRQQGFTLVELIIVLVIVAALGVGITNFIGRSVQGVADTAERQKLAQVAWIVSEKLSRSLREALPNSVRLGAAGSCIEFIPTLAGTDYLSVPVASASTIIEAIPLGTSWSGLGGSSIRFAVYPSSINGLYNLSAKGVISSPMTQLEQTGKVKITLASAHQFLADSPSRRLYLVQSPEMYCFEAGRLNLYRNYGFNSSMPASAGLTGAVVATDIERGQFVYQAGTLARSAVVTFNFEISEGGVAAQALNQEVQLRNVP